jgi:hypothetical protein
MIAWAAQYLRAAKTAIRQSTAPGPNCYRFPHPIFSTIDQRQYQHLTRGFTTTKADKASSTLLLMCEREYVRQLSVDLEGGFYQVLSAEDHLILLTQAQQQAAALRIPFKLVSSSCSLRRDREAP